MKYNFEKGYMEFYKNTKINEANLKIYSQINISFIVLKTTYMRIAI